MMASGFPEICCPPTICAICKRRLGFIDRSRKMYANTRRDHHVPRGLAIGGEPVSWCGFTSSLRAIGRTLSFKAKHMNKKIGSNCADIYAEPQTPLSAIREATLSDNETMALTNYEIRRLLTNNEMSVGDMECCFQNLMVYTGSLWCSLSWKT